MENVENTAPFSLNQASLLSLIRRSKGNNRPLGLTLRNQMSQTLPPWSLLLFLLLLFISALG